MKKNDFTIKAGLSFLLTILGFQSCKAPAKNSPLPYEFSQYAVLNSTFKSDKFEVILLAENKNYGTPHPFRLFHSIKNQIILEANRDENPGKEGYYYYKLDKNANIIDSLFFPFSGGERMGFIDDYTVHTRSIGACDYTTWPLNGDKTPIKIAVLNEDFSWSQKKIDNLSEEITSDATYYFYDRAYYQPGDEEVDRCIKKTFFCKNGKWQVLHQKVDKKFKVNEQEDYRRYRKDFFWSSNDERAGATENLSLKYFNKEKEMKYEHSVGGGSPSFTKKGWVGTGFFDIPLLNDTLKIKKQNLIVEEGTPGDSKTRYYISNGEGQSVTPFNLNIFADNSLNYVLYSTSAYYVYAIRKTEISR